MAYKCIFSRYEEFNGPCAVCLEPDEDSRNRITELRDLLLEEPELSRFASYGPTLTLSDMFPFSTSTFTSEYRPLVPIASFPTVTSAVEMARKLRALWEPLSVPVTDLHVVSNGVNSYTENYNTATYNEGSLQAWGAQPVRRKNERQIACDALIMLAGEEVSMDNEYNEAMANLIAQEGDSGGYARSEKSCDPDFSAHTDETSAINKWLDDFEDDEDEGTVVVIGRTHFFTGEMREYMGMPAARAVEAKGRVIGGISPAARRGRGAALTTRSKGSGRPRRKTETSDARIVT